MEIKEYKTQDFENLKSEWTELAKGKDMTYFQSFDWYKIINSHFCDEKIKNPFRSGLYLLVTDNDKPKMIAPIEIVHKGFFFKGIGVKKGFYFIGRQGYSDYLNFIYTDFDAECVKAVIDYLKNKFSMNCFILENLSKETAAGKYFSGMESADILTSLCMRISLPDEFETYRKNLSKSVRQNIRTAFNRAERDGKHFEYEIKDSIDEKLADELMAIRAQRLTEKEKNTFNSLSTPAKVYIKARKAIVDISNKPVDVMKEVDKCWCFIVRESGSGKIAAFFYSVYFQPTKTVYLILAGVDKEYEWYSPGTAQLYQYISDEIEKGKPDVEFLDLTRGDEKYKYDLKAKEIETVQVTFFD